MAQLPGQVLLTVDLRLKLPAAGVTVRRLPGKPEVFGVQGLQGGIQSLPQTVIVLAAGLQSQHLLGGVLLLLSGHIQLILGLLQVPAGFLRPVGGLAQGGF